MSIQIQIGNITIHRIVEQEGPFFAALQFFPTLTQELLEENRAWLQPRFLDAAGKLLLCIQSYLVQTRHHNILIDTCVGNDKPRPARAFSNKPALGFDNSTTRSRPQALPVAVLSDN